ncbi:MAG: hypothetical protein K2P78_13435 [Gemmataceae bacterium]|nr:hypothetical protein [Gemmataceae bacterium]
MSVREDTDGLLLPAVDAAPRALVFLTVPWSGPERVARAAFRSAAERLAAESPELGVECFALDEEAGWCQTWLAGLGLPQLGGGYPLGAGSMVWLESGRAVSHEVGGCSLRPGGIVARARWLWAADAEPGAAADRGRM